MGKKGSRKSPPKDETPEQRFVRIATPRICKAVKSIDLLANCTGPGYAYSDKQVQQVLTALQDAVNRVAGAFNKKSKGTDGFKFE